MKYCDLHIHSIYSDGTYTPEQIYRRASSLNLKAIVICDHDNFEALSESYELSKKYNIETMSGVEISCMYNNEETHILGYGFDPNKKSIKELVKRQMKERMDAVKKMITLLDETYGFKMSFKELKALIHPKSKFLGRPHIAKMLYEKGYVPNKKGAFTKDFIANHGKCYIPTGTISIPEVSQAIKDSDGIAILAHPHYFQNKPFTKEQTAEYIKVGLDGIEAFHRKFRASDSQHYINLANELAVIYTGGSDCHGDLYKPVAMGTKKVPYEVFENLKKIK